MKTYICETLAELNSLLGELHKDIQVKIKFNSHVVGSRKDMNGQEHYEVVDRFLVITNEYSTEDKRATKKG